MRNRVAVGSALVLALGIQTALARTASDAQTLAKIQDKVYHAGVLKHGEVAVTYNHGVATLIGTVDNL